MPKDLGGSKGQRGTSNVLLALLLNQREIPLQI